MKDDSVTDRLFCKDADGRRRSSLHVYVDGVSPKLCAVIRELVLRAHYMGFDEENGKNQSVITVLCDKGRKEEAEDQLRNAPFLGNYINYLWGTEELNPLDYLEVMVNVEEKSDDMSSYDDPLITEDELNVYSDCSNEIDIIAAKRANSIYCIGCELYNLPDISPEDIEMYEIPLRLFETETFADNPDDSWKRLSLKHKISNVLCTDTFPVRLKMLGCQCQDVQTVTCEIEKHILELSKCEHSRWVAEKLIMGYKPWTARHHYEYSIMFGDKKKEYHKRLKAEEYHLDICSYDNLCRLDPKNRKFDTFLILSCLKQ